MHFGPGRRWERPDETWITIDVDPKRGDIVVNLNSFDGLPLPTACAEAIYASHTFEHVSILNIRTVMAECHRVLAPGGVLRAVTPNPVISMRHYMSGNADFELFARRRSRARQRYGEEYTLFECLREDFLSRSGQTNLLGESLAHQNAWDFETMRADLARSGFEPEHITERRFREIGSPDFAFEGTYPSEANEDYRSLYVEAIK